MLIIIFLLRYKFNLLFDFYFIILSQLVSHLSKVAAVAARILFSFSSVILASICIIIDFVFVTDHTISATLIYRPLVDFTVYLVHYWLHSEDSFLLTKYGYFLSFPVIFPHPMLQHHLSHAELVELFLTLNRFFHFIKRFIRNGLYFTVVIIYFLFKNFRLGLNLFLIEEYGFDFGLFALHYFLLFLLVWQKFCIPIYSRF